MKKMLWMVVMLMASVLTIGAQEATEDVDVKYAANLLKPGTEAPDFEIQNNDSVKDVKLSDFRGKYVVLEFWASWCPDCRKDMPEVKALYERYGKKGVQFIGISFDTDKAAWSNYIAKNGLSWLHTSELVKWKKGTKIDQAYQVQWIPTYYLLDPEGKVVLGTVMLEKLKTELERLEREGLVKLPTAFDAEIFQLPQYPGGDEARKTFLSKNLVYPEAARKYEATGKVKMSFVVGADGRLGDFNAVDCVIDGYNQAKFDKLTGVQQQELKRQIMLAFAKESYRVMKKMPAWIPGKREGKAVSAKCTQTISFRSK